MVGFLFGIRANGTKHFNFGLTILIGAFLGLTSLNRGESKLYHLDGSVCTVHP